MFKITNIEALGTDYTVADRKGNVIKTIQVIPHDEILEAALGSWDESESLSSYLEKSIAVLTGFDILQPNTTMWFSTDDDQVKLSSVFEYAIANGFDRIILEYLDEIDDNGMFVIKEETKE
jgi:hypothetical protein